jgi:hypothetical protein
MARILPNLCMRLRRSTRIALALVDFFSGLAVGVAAGSPRRLSARGDYKSRRRLRAVAFWVPPFTAEANVQDRRVGRRVWNNPIEVRGLRVEYWRNADREGTAAIERQKDFHLTPHRVSQAGKRSLPLEPDVLPRM